MSKKKSDDYYIFFRDDDKLYGFIKIKQSEDGSVLIIFPKLHKGKGISQRLSLCREENSALFHPEVHEIKMQDKAEENTTYITYHSTGQINYHNMRFDSMYMEPLSQITQVNLFFILSFQTMDAFNVIEDISTISPQNYYIYDIPQLHGKRKDILFSIAPTSIQPFEEISKIVSLNCGDLFRLMLEIDDDEQVFCFSNIYGPEDCVKLRPYTDMFSEKVLTKNQAYLKYQHRIYQTNDMIILAPNSEGIIKIIFEVEMRKAPWVKIEFIDKNYEIRNIQRQQTTLSFKIFNNKSKQYVKSAEEMSISNIILDAEIYDDESIPPIGFI